jgi:hypothetical protein
MMDSDNAVRKLTSDIRRTLKQYWNGHQRGEVSDQMWKDVLYMASWLAEQAPDGRKMEVLNKAMIDVEFDNDKSIMHMYMDTLEKDKLTPAQMKGAIKNMNMPPEAEATIMGWVDNIMDDRIRNDAELLEAIQKGNMQ